MPEQVDRWLAAIDVAQPEVRDLIERQMRYTAQRVLGSYRDKLLLSIPPREMAAGAIQLGTALYDKAYWPVGISPEELTQHVGIYGRSGAGKTNATFHVVIQLIKQRVPFLFLDWKRTARHLLPHFGNRLHVYTPGRSVAPFPFNPFMPPPGLEPNVYASHVVDVLGDAYTLGDGAKSVVQRALSSCYAQGNSAPTVAEVLQALEGLVTKERATGWKISAKRALETLELSDASARGKEAQLEFAKSLLSQNTILELDALSQATKKFLVPLLCYWIYCVRLACSERESLRFVIFLEEAHHVMYRQQGRAKESLMEMLLRQCRELGIGVVVIDQHPHMMSSAVLGNCFTTVCLNQKDPADINKAAALSLVDDGDKRHFSLLPTGQGVVKLQDRWPRPFLVQFPLVRIHKGAVSDAALARFVQGKSALSDLREWPGSLSTMAGRSREGDRVLEEGAFDLLNDIVRHPDDGVDRRYKRLGISVDRGNRYKQQLVRRGLVEPTRVKVGRTYRTVLCVAEDAARLLSWPSADSIAHESPAHQYWKHHYGQLYAAQGYHVSWEAPRRQGKADILAERASESVAVEIETGKSDAVSNVRQDLLAGFGRVLVVATDETAFRQVERQLAKAGLLLPSRVTLVLRDDAIQWQDRRT